MDIASYRQKKLKDFAVPTYRGTCAKCFQTPITCLCALIQPFDPKVKFVILIHPIEFRRRIATGKLSHLCLKNSELVMGNNFTESERINQHLRHPHYHCVVLYPGKKSLNLTQAPKEAHVAALPPEKELVIFVVDGTWHTAKSMMRLSQNLAELPQICFTPPRPSTFRVRKQPKPECFSTIEAIHHTLELLGDSRGYDPSTKQHDNLLKVFDALVEQQLVHTKNGVIRRKFSRHRKAAPDISP